MSIQKLGNYIRQVDTRNTKKKVSLLLGVSIEKQFIESIANTIGTDMSTYKIVSKGQFAYGPVTSRNGDKVSIALLEQEECIISSSYTVFEITDTEVLLPQYLMLWFRRPEFDRYARFHSHGSAREIFDWDELCNVLLPVPAIDEQKAIVKRYADIEHRITLKRKINDNLEAQARSILTKISEENERASEHEIIRIADLCKANKANISKEQQKQKVLYLDTGSITKNYIDGFQILDPSVTDFPSRCKRRVKHSDIVYSTVRPNLCHHGIILEPENNLIVSTGFAVLSSAQNRIANEIIYLLITQDRVQTILQNIAEMSVSTYPSIDVENLLDLEFEYVP